MCASCTGSFTEICLLWCGVHLLYTHVDTIGIGMHLCPIFHATLYHYKTCLQKKNSYELHIGKYTLNIQHILATPFHQREFPFCNEAVL